MVLFNLILCFDFILIFFCPYFVIILIFEIQKLDPNQRITIDQVLHHPYITDHDTIDPLVLYSQPAVPLPEKSSENNGGSTSEQDKEWARRQCSIVWAPMPNNYNFSNQLTNQNKVYILYSFFVDFIFF